MTVSGFELKSVSLQSLFTTDTPVPLTIQGSRTLASAPRERCNGLLRETERLLENIAWSTAEGRVGNRSLGDGGPCDGL